MNDIEDLLREELLARAQAAERAEPATRRSVMLSSLERRIGRRRLRRRLAASALTAATVTAAVVLPVTGLPFPGTSTGPAASAVPLSDPRLTPPGWAPVPFLGAQVSVPASFVFTIGALTCSLYKTGVVYVGEPPQPGQRTNATGPTCGMPPTVVSIRSAPDRAGQRWSGARERLNGLEVLALPNGSGVIIPGLDIVVTARGPLASQILATVTRSPLSVVLSRGPAFRVPDAWRWHDFGGIKFATPASWSVKRGNDLGNGCGAPIARRTVVLSNARRLLVSNCPLYVPIFGVGSDAPVPGVIVAAGRWATFWYHRPATPSAQTPCLTLHGLRACTSRLGLSGALLSLYVQEPGRSRPVLVQIGLTGTGATARTILDSIRPAGH